MGARGRKLGGAGNPPPPATYGNEYLVEYADTIET